MQRRGSYNFNTSARQTLVVPCSNACCNFYRPLPRGILLCLGIQYHDIHGTLIDAMLFEAQSLLYFIGAGDFADSHFNVECGNTEMYRGSKLLIVHVTILTCAYIQFVTLSYICYLISNVSLLTNYEYSANKR